MANRIFTQFSSTMERAVVSLYLHATFGSSGAVTLDTANSKGVVSITKESGTGLYTIVFGTQAGMLDVYNKLLGICVMFDESGNSGTAPAAPLAYVKANSVATFGTCSLQLQFTDKAQSAANPASTEAVYIRFDLKNSTAP